MNSLGYFYHLDTYYQQCDRFVTFIAAKLLLLTIFVKDNYSMLLLFFYKLMELFLCVGGVSEFYIYSCVENNGNNIDDNIITIQVIIMIINNYIVICNNKYN